MIEVLPHQDEGARPPNIEKQADTPLPVVPEESEQLLDDWLRALQIDCITACIAVLAISYLICLYEVVTQ